MGLGYSRLQMHAASNLTYQIPSATATHPTVAEHAYSARLTIIRVGLHCVQITASPDLTFQRGCIHGVQPIFV